MAIIASAGDGKTFIPAPAGLHQAVCVDIVDLGMVESTYDDEIRRQHKVRMVWQVEDVDGTRYIVQRMYTCSLHERASLRKDLESWRGKPFTPDELVAFDLEKLLGINCQINIQHADRKGVTYANVISVVPLGRGMAPLKPKDYVRVKDRSDEQASQPIQHVEPDLETVPF